MKVTFAKQPDPEASRAIKALCVYARINSDHEALGLRPPYDTRELEIQAHLRSGPVRPRKV